MTDEAKFDQAEMPERIYATIELHEREYGQSSENWWYADEDFAINGTEYVRSDLTVPPAADGDVLAALKLADQILDGCSEHNDDGWFLTCIRKLRAIVLSRAAPVSQVSSEDAKAASEWFEKRTAQPSDRPTVSVGSLPEVETIRALLAERAGETNA